AHALGLPAQRRPGQPDRQRAAAPGRHGAAHRGRHRPGRAVLPQAARGRVDHRRGGLQLLRHGPERGPGLRDAEGLRPAQGRGAFGAGPGQACLRGADGGARCLHLPAEPAAHPRAGQRHRLLPAPAGPRRPGPRRLAGGAQPAAGRGGAEQDPAG
ncbi:hypothetical protein OY671_011626, partial [Metschnikowia pulcherrima]